MTAKELIKKLSLFKEAPVAIHGVFSTKKGEIIPELKPMEGVDIYFANGQWVIKAVRNE